MKSNGKKGPAAKNQREQAQHPTPRHPRTSPLPSAGSLEYGRYDDYHYAWLQVELNSGGNSRAYNYVCGILCNVLISLVF